MSKLNTIIAFKGDKTREFTLEKWNALPDHKYQWQVKADKPKDLTPKAPVQAAKTTEEAPSKDAQSSLSFTAKNVKDLAMVVNELETIAAVESFFEGDERTFALKVKENRIAQISIDNE